MLGTYKGYSLPTPSPSWHFPSTAPVMSYVLIDTDVCVWRTRLSLQTPLLLLPPSYHHLDCSRELHPKTYRPEHRIPPSPHRLSCGSYFMKCHHHYPVAQAGKLAFIVIPLSHSSSNHKVLSLNLRHAPQGSSCWGSAEMNPTRNHEDLGSIPGLTQCVKDPVLPQALV